MKRKYAVVDLETTGGIPKRDKITEIAIIIFDGENIIEEFQSLINPERSIPPNITRITGITNEMVIEAPRFFELAKTIVELTEGAVFVAHNVQFDYRFLQEEFKSLGYSFSKRKLCTVRLSRKAFPGLRSYSLGHLIRHFGIEVENRHRAYDDALATTRLLSRAFGIQKTKKEIYGLVTEGIKLTRLPGSLSPETIENLPEACGVYYFRDRNDDVIYVGKSINIKKRVKQHFTAQNRKANKLLQYVTQISYEITGSELLSLLQESYDIKQIKPRINRAQKNSLYDYAITVAQDPMGYLIYQIGKAGNSSEELSYFSSRTSATQHVKRLTEMFELCPRLNKLERSSKSCFQYTLKKCRGACVAEEPVEEYNSRFEESMLIANRIFKDSFILKERGKTLEEEIIFLVEEGHYRGFGKINSSEMNGDLSMIRDIIKPQKINPEADLIVRNYIHTKPEIQLKYLYDL